MGHFQPPILHWTFSVCESSATEFLSSLLSLFDQGKIESARNTLLAMCIQVRSSSKACQGRLSAICVLRFSVVVVMSRMTIRAAANICGFLSPPKA